MASQCPQCQAKLYVVIGALVYPFFRGWNDCGALVCWRCGIARRRGTPWERIDEREHAKQWRRWTKDLEKKDGGEQ